MLQRNNFTFKAKALLDMSAIIALLKKEPGYELLEEVIASSAVSAVNLSELVSVLIRAGIEESEVDEIIKDIVPEIIPFSDDIAVNSGKLIKQTKEFGLSLGDRACVATGIHYNIPIYTTDKVWKRIKAQANIIIIR
jgi:PIN domain nuclease of toxin-antitoxin system